MWKSLVACTLATMLVGCAGPLKKQAFNKEASGHIKTVIVTQAPNQDLYEAAVLGHPGMSFGLIGGLVAAVDIQAKSNKLTAAIDPKETRLQERFAAKLKDGLSKAGYEVSVAVVPKDTKDENVVSVVKEKTSGDAIVSVNVFGSYWAAGPSSDYFPRVFARVKALDAAKGTVLYEDVISYGYADPNSQSIHLASEPQYRFATIDTLVSDPGKTREGLYTGLDAIVAQIVADLKRN